MLGLKHLTENKETHHMRSLTDSKPAIAAVLGLTLVGALAGCSTPAASVDQPADDATSQASTPTAEAPAETAGGTYSDGTYSDTENYQSPNGTETIDVSITLKGDVITAVEVVGRGDNPDSKHYQDEFIGGISAAVVGQDIDSISVSKVAGSSLTSGGFNKAVDAVKAEAAA